MLRYTTTDDFQIVSDALRSIPFPLSYHDWVRIGLALYATFGMQGMELLHEVSCAPFPKYRGETPQKLAAKFRNANGRVSLGTVFHLARRNGWKYERPTKIQNEAWHLVAWHDYTDAQGQFAYRMNRYVSPDGSKKRMTVERYENGKRKFDLPPELRLPYNLPAVRQAIDANELIYFVEGESDADALAANGFVATCVPFGANGWNQRYAGYFKDARICLIPDNDASGKALPLKAIPDLLGVAKEVKVVELRDAKDARELINTKGVEAFLSLTPIDASEYLAKHKLPEAYPLTRLNTPVPETDFDDATDLDETLEIDSYANIDYTFDESLVPNGIFREAYDYIAREADAPPQFIFTGVLAMFCAIVGTRISLNCGSLKVKPHDYFTLITKSGGGKSTTLESVRSILSTLEREITDKPYCNVFLFPQSSTLRGLLDALREESEAEFQARLNLEAKGKPVPPPKQAQRSGVAVIDEISILFDATKSEFNTGLDGTLLLLWDGNPRMIATSLKNDGKMRFEDSALTLLAASTPKKFAERLPKGALLDGMFARFQIVNAESRTQPRKPLTAYTSLQTNHGAIVAKLKRFFEFVSDFSKSNKPVLISEEAKALDAQSVKFWHDECERLNDETADGYMQRIDMRKLRYALLFATLESYDTHGKLADNITLTGTAMQRAIAVCNYYKKHMLHSIVKVKAIKPKAPNQNEPLTDRVKNKIIELGGTVEKRKLQRALSMKDNDLLPVLNELIATKQVVCWKQKNKKGQFVNVVAIPKKSENGSDMSDMSDMLKNNLTETEAKLQNGSTCQKSTCQNGSDVLNSDIETDLVEPEPEPTPQPAPTSPMPAPPEPASPEPTPATNPAAKPGPTAPKRSANPLPKPESLLLANACEIARSLHTEFTAREFINEAMLFHGMTFETAKQMLNALLKEGYVSQGKYTYVRMPKLYNPEPQVKSSPTPEPEPESPVEPVGLPFPDAATIDDLASYTMNYLEQTWSCRKIPGEQLRAAIKKIAEKRVNAVWNVLFPAHIVKLHTTDFYILRKHELRPPGYEGLLDDKGVLPDADPAPF